MKTVKNKFSKEKKKLSRCTALMEICTVFDADWKISRQRNYDTFKKVIESQNQINTDI